MRAFSLTFSITGRAAHVPILAPAQYGVTDGFRAVARRGCPVAVSAACLAENSRSDTGGGGARQSDERFANSCGGDGP